MGECNINFWIKLDFSQEALAFMERAPEHEINDAILKIGNFDF